MSITRFGPAPSREAGPHGASEIAGHIVFAVKLPAEVQEAVVGDEVVIIGKSGSVEIKAGDVAQKCAMTESELLRSLARCIPSVCIEDEKTFISNPICMTDQ